MVVNILAGIEFVEPDPTLPPGPGMCNDCIALNLHDMCDDCKDQLTEANDES